MEDLGIELTGVFHDLVGVELPQFGPAVGVLEEARGDAPQRVAGSDDVAVRRAFCQLQWGSGLGEGQSA